MVLDSLAFLPGPWDAADLFSAVRLTVRERAAAHGCPTTPEGFEFCGIHGKLAPAP